MSKILIADYNSKELQRLKQLFEGEGFKVISANDGPSVIAKFEEEKPDVILLSAMLSRKNGLEVCKKIKMSPDGANIPVIIATSIYKGKNYQMKAKIDYKADEYVEKPISDDKLLELVKKHLEKDFFSEEILAETASRRKHKVEEKENITSSKIDKDISDTDDLDKLISETLSGLGMEIKAKRKREKELKSKETEEKKLEIKEDKVEKVEKIVEEIKEEEKIKPEKEVTERKVSEKKEKKVKMDTDAEIDALLKDTLSLALDLDKDTIKEEKAKKDKDTGELMLEKIKEEVVKKEEKSEGEKAVEKILSSFDTDIEKKLSDTLHGVGLSDTNLEKTLEPREEEIEEEKEEEEEGIKFGDYYLVEKIGHGGMAELFKAKKKGEKGFQKILAIKRILPHLSDNKELVTMFIDEAKLAAQLSHQNIATIFDFGKIDNSYYIAMEYVDGFDLKKILSKAKELNVKIPHKLAAYIAEQICSALDYAHHKRDYKGKELKIVHRDVSPQNILISKEGEVKLVDFGISKAESKIHHTVKGALKGKLLYMSPEQAWGKDVDKRSDVYSMGIVLCEMVSGKVLFEDSSEYDVLEKVRSGKMPILDNEIGKIPPKLRKIIEKALEIDIEKRYQTAAEMAADLRKYINETKPVPTSKDLRTFLTRLYPEAFGLKPEEVKNLSFDDFMEKGKGPELLSADTLIIPEEKVEKVKEKAEVSEEPKVEMEEPKPKPKKKVVVKKKVVKKTVQKEKPVVTDKKKVVEEKKTPKKKEPPKKVKKTVVTKKLRKEEAPKVEFGTSLGSEEKKEGGKNKLILIAAVLVIIIGVVLFFVFSGGGKEEAKKPVKVANVNSIQPGEENAASQNNIPEENNLNTSSQKTQSTQNIAQEQKPVSTTQKKVVKKTTPNVVKNVTPPPRKNVVKKTVNKPKKVVENIKPENKVVKNEVQTPQKKEVVNKPVESKPKPFVKPEKPKVVQNKPVSNNLPNETVVNKPKTEVKPKPVETKPKPKVVVSKPEVVATKPTANLPSKKVEVNKNVLKEGDIVPLDSSVIPPKPIKTPKPNYPSKARILRAHATVIARILVNHFGDIEKVRIITVIPSRNRPLFADSVVTSLKKWKFKPAVKNGIKVKVWKTVRIKF